MRDDTSPNQSDLESDEPNAARGESRNSLLRGVLVLLGIGMGLLATLTVVLILLALSSSSRQVVATPAKPPALDRAGCTQRLSQAIQIRTISHEGQAQPAELQAFLSFLAESFPRVHDELTVERVNRHSLLVTWAGNDQRALPLLLLAHYDVVPAAAQTLKQWQQPPFSGAIDDQFVWGRGTLDDKGSVMAILEALEYLLSQGHEPPRTIIVALGHDEEIGGEAGAKQLAATLAKREVKPWMVLDEGLVITEGIIPNVEEKVALIGVAEKGYVTLELAAVAETGHSSMPPRQTAVGILSRAIARLENRGMPASLTGPPRAMFEHLAPEMPFLHRVVLANLWLTEPLVRAQLATKPSTDAILRTTTAPTMLRAGVKDNVLAHRAVAVVNFRIKPGDSIAAVIQHVESVVADERVVIQKREGNFGSEPSNVSSWNAPQYAALARAIREVHDETIVAPSITLGATDARHYAALSEHVYRFAPIVLGPDDTPRVHGINERIAIDDYLDGIHFYIRLIVGAGQELANRGQR